MEPIIQSIRINGQHQSFNPKIPLFLSALDDDLVLFFKPSTRTQYYFLLENYETYWQQSPYPMVRYTNLGGGNYILKVRSYRDGNFSKIISIPIEIENSLTEEWWFLPSVIFYSLLLLGAGIYFLLLYNFREKLKVETIRQKIASDLHDEVGATLSSIAIATRVVQKKWGNQANDLASILAQIKEDSEETIQTIRDTVWAINPENDSVEILFEKMRSFALQILTVQNIALDFQNEYHTGKLLKMSMEQRRNVYLIFKEAINNIAKHAQATKVSVLISQTKEGFKLEISDNGKGFNYQENYEGNGLRNFQKRADESFMEFKMKSEIGKGTDLEVMVFEV
ncbi:MAG: histidine kinase [Arcicella sp.]|nr:histidine kinase [Arcicella sp.]